MTVNVKKTAATAATAGILGLGAVGLGSGIGQAAPGVPGPPVPPVPPVPGPAVPGIPGVPGVPDDLIPWDGPNINPAWMPGMPPGQNPFGPPGQVAKMTTLTLPGGVTVPNPFYGLPPGQWGTVAWNPADIGITLPGGEIANLIWDTARNAWGYVINGEFFRFPVQFPPPPPS